MNLVAVASAGPYANHLHLASDRYPRQHLITHFSTGRMLCLSPNQQRQSTENKWHCNCIHGSTNKTEPLEIVSQKGATR